MNGRRDRALLAITAEGFLSRLSFGLINLALPLYALKLHMNITEIGALTSINVVIQIALKPFMGAIADRFGPRRSLISAVALRSFVPLLFVVAHVPWQLFAIRLFYGITQSWRDPSLNAVIAEVGGKKKVASAFAWYHTAKNTASSIGRAIAGLLLSVTAGNYPLVFAIGFLLSILPLVPVWRGLPADPPRAPRLVPAPMSRTLALAPAKLDLRVLRFSFLGFLYGLTAGMLGLFPVIAKQNFGLTPAEIGMIMLVSTVVVLISGPLFGWLADNVSRNVVLLVRAAANTCSSIVLMVAHGAVLVGSGRAVDDMGKAAFRPAWGSIMAEVASFDKRTRARTMSLIDVGEDTGDALGPVLAGALIASGGLIVMLTVRVALAITTEAATWMFTHGSQPAADPPATVAATRDRALRAPAWGPPHGLEPATSRVFEASLPRPIGSPVR